MYFKRQIYYSVKNPTNSLNKSFIFTVTKPDQETQKKIDIW